MRYGIEQYDQHGLLKTPVLLWVGWAFLIRAWVVFVVAGASRQEGSTILQYVYPNHTMLYLGLAMGLPIVVGMWLVGLRKSDSTKTNFIVSQLKPVTLLIVILQLAHTVYLVDLQHWQFTWTNAVTLVSLIWFAIYLLNSRRVADSLALPAKIT
ncbi:arginine/ornithine antiporter ArcD [Vibrio maritimus]|uniref:Arginine/ornithine antiporter ArcD n=1 Tax=Vibrio maritimus TaxID=990268 RepID=A0A090RX31_9VIBR|nr:arginine/ornithine antiporter ArcD [Vibrio maritimus]